MKLIYLLLFITLTLFARGYESPDNRSQAKNVLMMMHLDYKVTAVNSCQYDYDKSSCMDKSMVNGTSCQMEEQNLTMRWMQVVPDTFYGREYSCMAQQPCTNIFSKKAFGGPMCCRRIDVTYRKMEADLFNLIPVVSLLAEQQNGRIFYDVVKVDVMLGKVKADQQYLEPPDETKGNIARVYLYMDETYDLHLSAKQKETYLRWHQKDAVDAKECDLGQLILKVQGGNNHWIEEGCKRL